MSRLIWLTGVLVAVLSVGTAAPIVRAQTPIGIVNAIRIDGNQRIETETIASYLAISRGDQFDTGLISKSLKKLFATGLFADVNMMREGNTLVIRVRENPIINRIVFEGNKRIKDELLSSEVGLRPRVVFTRTRVQDDVTRILEIYRRSGRFAATVEAKIIKLAENRVNLVFEINEGPKTGIKRINFIGNHRFSNTDLRDTILTKETSLLNFFVTGDTYDPDRLTFDRDLLRRFYLSKGYADFRVVSAIAELTRDRTGFFITFTVDEGKRYRFGKIEIDSKLRDLSTDTLFKDVNSIEGDWYNAVKVQDSIQALTNTVGNLGFSFVDITPRVEQDRDKLIIDLTYEIAEGPRVYVERINITGNIRTLDKVIRREFLLVEGDAFNAAKYQRSQQRIRNLGFFKSVNVTRKVGSKPDKIIIEAEVAETSTGQLSFGAGFSSADGALLNVSIDEKNLLGRGQKLHLSFMISKRRKQVDLGFTEPYFLGRDVSAGADLFVRQTDLTNRNNFDDNSKGFSLQVGYTLRKNLELFLRYSAQHSTLTKFSKTVSPFIRLDKGSRVSSVFGYTLSYDLRDSFFNPTEGYIVRFEQDVAGLGGDAKYLKSQISGKYFYPISDFFTGMLAASGGHILGFSGKRLRIDERFFIGGQNFRGFTVAGIGPRDLRTQDPLGGNSFAMSTVEVSFPIEIINAVDLRGRLFTDMGTLYGTGLKGEGLVDSPKLRASAGVGFSYQSPFGPIQLDFSFPFLKQKFDKTETFQFSFGTRF